MFHRFSDRIWYMDEEEATDRPVLGYVRGQNRSLMIDAGNSRRHAEQFLGCLRQAGLPSPDLVVLTHSHWDHTYGLCALDALSLACAATCRDLERDAALTWNSENLRRYCEEGLVLPFCEEHMRVEYPRLEEIAVAVPQVEFQRELKLELGGCPVLVRQLENPHTADGTVVYLPGERVLFIGDAACGELAGNEWVLDKGRLLRFKQALEQLDFTHCFTGHDAPMPREELFARFDERLEM